METMPAAPPTRILDAFRDQAFVGEQRGPVPIGASIGVATFPAEGRTATELIAGADAALYQVKRDGGHDVRGSRRRRGLNPPPPSRRPMDAGRLLRHPR